MRKNQIWFEKIAQDYTIDDRKLLTFEKAIHKSQMKSCLVLHKGYRVIEYYKNKKIKQNIQRINSCTKSILSMLVGIAYDQGVLPSLQKTIGDYFPELCPLEDKRKEQITIEQLLTMSCGLDWPEFGEWNYMPPMFSRNVIEYILNRPLIEEPGKMMNYNSGCSHILSAILTKSTGRKTADFAKEFLFDPLGIYDYRWYEDANDISYGSDGLHLHPESLAKLGQLYLQKGRWEDRQLVSESWISYSTKPQYLTYPAIGQYGSHWWVEAPQEEINSAGTSIYFAMGRGGAFLIIDPGKEFVIACTGNSQNTMAPFNLVRAFLASVG